MFSHMAKGYPSWSKPEKALEFEEMRAKHFRGFKWNKLLMLGTEMFYVVFIT